MNATGLFYHLDTIARAGGKEHHGALQAATLLCENAHRALVYGQGDDGERLLTECFEVVQAALGPDDRRLAPFLEYFASLAEARGVTVRARALRRRARRLGAGP
jgi:hypothetical protein